jgi:alkaline phosphatase
MKRRSFISQTTAGLAGSALITSSAVSVDYGSWIYDRGNRKKAKNIIFMVSDGMSNGTLTMADHFLQRKEGRGSHWLDLYRQGKAKRGMMDMSSANSMVTDSAAASSSWGGGVRVQNGKLNTGPKGEKIMPIWQKFQKAGKKTGCVTTVPITHATPAGFCVNSDARSDQEGIALQYLGLRFDVMMGGGAKYFTERKDQQNLLDKFTSAGYQVATSVGQMNQFGPSSPALGVFDKDGLPYSLDRDHQPELQIQVPTLADMTAKAISLMKEHPNGFCLQVEGGKVDWAAHQNDAPALIYDQLAFDEAVKVALDFAEKDGDTLVIITTDHGNANPGLFYGAKADAGFDSLFTVKHTNEWILRQIGKDDNSARIQEIIMQAQGYTLTEQQLAFLTNVYAITSEKDLKNEYKLPFKELALFLGEQTHVSFGSMDHSADYTELTMIGPGSEKMPTFVRNTDLHYFMLDVAEVENKF